MKALPPAILGIILLAGSAPAGRVGVDVNFGGGYGGCAPRYYAPPVCHAPRIAPGYYSAPTVFFRQAPVFYYSSAPIVCAPSNAPVYKAPIVTDGIVDVRTVSFGWRR